MIKFSNFSVDPPGRVYWEFRWIVSYITFWRKFRIDNSFLIFPKYVSAENTTRANLNCHIHHKNKKQKDEHVNL